MTIAFAFLLLQILMAVAVDPTTLLSRESNTPPGFWTAEKLLQAEPYQHPYVKRTGSSTSRNASTSCNPPYEVTNYDDMPYKAIGRLYFSRGGEEYTCSASYVSSFSVVLTAGHCCYNEDQWSDNWVLTLDYPAKTTRYYAKAAHVVAGWQRGKYEYDFCWLEMADSGPAYLGWQTHEVGQAVDAYGYPENFGSNEQLYGASGGFEMKNGDETEGEWEMNCNPMRKGNSGGPWIASGRVVGLNSNHGGGATDMQEWSPYFGDAMYKSCQAAGGCPSSNGSMALARTILV